MVDAADDPVARLAQYWFRAKLMHDYLHAMKEECGGNLQTIYDEGNWWELNTYLSYWLSALFVVVEGFNKLKLKDARVQKCFKGHLRHLKAMRHETYHFVASIDTNATKVIRELNWAEELHEAMGDFLQKYALTKADEEKRAKKALKRKKRAL